MMESDEVKEEQGYKAEESISTKTKNELPQALNRHSSNSTVKAIQTKNAQNFDQLDPNSNSKDSENTVKEKVTQISKKTTKKRKYKKRNRLEISNKDARNQAVVIKRADGLPMNRDLFWKIYKKLTNCMKEAFKKPNVKCGQFQFLKFGLVDAGYYLVTAANEQARDWLLTCNPGTYDGVAIKMYRRMKPKKRVLEKYKNHRKLIKKYIEEQNKSSSDDRVDIVNTHEKTIIKEEITKLKKKRKRKPKAKKMPETSISHNGDNKKGEVKLKKKRIRKPKTKVIDSSESTINMV